MYMLRVWDDFSEKLKEKVKLLRLGDGFQDDTDLGPLINAQAFGKVERHVHDAAAKGAHIICGGSKWDESIKRAFLASQLSLADVTDDMLVMKEETFGPVIPLQSFEDEDIAIEKANDTDYGLAAYIFTESLSRSMRVAEKLEYGIVGVNDVFPAAAEAPFGGIKQSGIGREGGHHGLHEFLELEACFDGD